ncbi:chalcone synthase 6-4-like [Rhodamnia argentea]|uniref:Chalcone synthase 6-4-like n=1 Tax=Rhodamnia argentea TaxID=178133 RepID=A0A8B8Q202_9MYRT|nr:chalcone synthase 6-4-like [Rhodamnia argentea]
MFFFFSLFHHVSDCIAGNRSGMKKRHFIMTEEIFKQNPGICSSGAPSLNQRQDLAIKVHPELAMEAATKAIEEWGQPKSAITHLIMCSTTGVDMPGLDAKLVHLLGLSPSINRLMLYSLGCHASGTVLRIAKDIAENNPEARILTVSVETNVLLFQAPTEDNPASLIPSCTFGDGAAAMVIGTVPLDSTAERPLFQIISTSQMLVPGTVGALTLECRENGIVTTTSKEVPQLISSNLEACLAKTFRSATNSDVVKDWNSIFWAVHLGYTQVFDRVEETLGLSKERLRASRHVREEYGNMLSATVVFILNELRNKSMKEGMATTGEGPEWGVLLGFGPGITIETVVLRSVPLQAVVKSRPFPG